MMYLFIYILVAFLAFVMQHWGAPNIELYSYVIGCQDIPGIDVSACKGEQAVYRICIGSAIWFAVLAIGSRLSDRVHNGMWFVKCAGLAALITGLFFVPIVGQSGYIQCARTISAFFLVAQIVSFVDLAYTWNSTLLERGFFKLVLGLCAAIMLIVMVALIIFFLTYTDCQRQTAFLSLTIVLNALFTILQLTTHDTENSLLTSCVVAAYCTYLCWSAISADPCNEDQPDEAQLVIGVAITIISLAWTCYSSAKTQTNAFFHVVFAIGSVYVSMLLTNWGTIAGQHSEVRMWITIASQWVATLMYTWTIVAPSCFPDRDFSPLANQNM